MAYKWATLLVMRRTSLQCQRMQRLLVPKAACP
jgi:hypothetical protein